MPGNTRAFGLGVAASVVGLGILGVVTAGIPCMQGQTCVLDKLQVRSMSGGNIINTTGGNALKLYVDNNGSDNNSGLTPTSALATMQAAELKVPKFINAPVEISVDAGNFACSTWDNFRFASDADAGVYGSLWVHGTLANATITGLQSGTVASATDITNVGGVLPTITVTGAGWTAHALRGLFFKITGGTGSGETLLISDNTATVITIAGGYQTSTAFWPVASIVTDICTPFAEYLLPDNTSTFKILNNATHITQECQVPSGPNPTGFMGSYLNESLNTFGIFVSGMRGDYSAGAFAFGGNQEPLYCSPNSPVAFTNFDFNDSNMNTGLYVTNSDSVQSRWNTFPNIAFFAHLWQNVNRMSLFQNAEVAGGCLIGYDSFAGDSALVMGNVVGKVDNSAGCLMYDGASYAPGPRTLYTGLNNFHTHGVRSAYNILGTQMFSEFDDGYFGYTHTGLVIGNSFTNTTVPYVPSVGTSALVASDEFEGLAGASQGIFLGSENYLYADNNIGDGGTFGIKIEGPAAAFFGNASGNTLGGTTNHICQDPNCTAPVKYSDVGQGKNSQYSFVGGAHSFTTAGTSVPASVGCADTAETVRGALVDVPCSVSPHSAPTSAGSASWNCYASAAGTLQLHLCCVSATCTANSVTWTLQQQN